MEENFNIQTIEGGYTHGGVNGSFKGELAIHEDGRVFGVMYDQGGDILDSSIPKLIIGRRLEQSLAFWKLNEDPRVASLVYSLKGVDGGFYEGRWVPIFDIDNETLFDGVEFGPAVQASFAPAKDAFDVQSESEKMSILSQIKKDDIEFFLRNELVQDVLNKSPNYGFLNLAGLRKE